MAARRATLEVDHVTDLFHAPARRQTPYDEKYARHTYRLPEALHQELKAIADDNGVGLNDLVRWVFRDFTARVDAGFKLPVEEYVVSVRRLSE